MEDGKVRRGARRDRGERNRESRSDASNTCGSLTVEQIITPTQAMRISMGVNVACSIEFDVASSASKYSGGRLNVRVLPATLY